MDMKQVGVYDNRFYQVAGFLADLPIMQSDGLRIHIEKRHPDSLKYLDKIEDIIQNPDYIGKSPCETGYSFELVKSFDKNVQIGIKIDISENYFYVSTLYTITEAKLRNRLRSGRLDVI
ncbi:MAG: PBECR2 nuclease fold domain-containing protein [Chordicoccus sp.]